MLKVRIPTGDGRGSRLERVEQTGSDQARASSQAFVARHTGAALDFGALLTDFMTMARENDLAMPTDLAILFKGLVTAGRRDAPARPRLRPVLGRRPDREAQARLAILDQGVTRKIEAVGAGCSARPPNCRP